MSFTPESRWYFLVNSLYHVGRVLPQAVLTPILVSKGLSFSEIALVQACFSASALVFEIPSGYLADLMSRKRVYLLASLFMLASYYIVFSQSGLGPMVLAWVLYGFADAAQTATMNFHFAEQFRHDDALLRRFYSWDKNLVFAVGIAAALLSPMLFSLIGSGLYLISLGLFGASLALGLLHLPGDSNLREDGRLSARGILLDARSALGSRPILLAVILLSLTELAITPFFQFWQMVLMDAQIPTEYFGFVYILFQVANIGANALFSRVGDRKSLYGISLAAIAVVGILVWWIGTAGLVACLLILPLPLSLFLARCEVDIQRIVPAESMSTVGSVSSATCQVLSLSVLVGASACLNYVPARLLLALGLVAFAATATLVGRVAWRAGSSRLEASGPPPESTLVSGA